MSSVIDNQTAISLNKLPVGKYLARLVDASGKTLNQKSLVIH